MATIRAYTTIEQSRKLAKILPLESADMFYRNNGIDVKLMWEHNAPKVENPCWSIAALFDVLPNGTDIVKEDTDTENEKYMCTIGIKNDIISMFGNNLVDACVEIILKLHKQNIL